MSMVSSFGFTNVTPYATTIAPVDLGLDGNYSKPTVVQGKTVYSNITAPTGQPELVTIKAQPISYVETDVKNRNPGKVSDGIQYTIKLDELLRTTSSDDPSWKLDESIVASLQIRHVTSDYITSSHVEEVFQRLAGATRDENGNPIWDRLMRGDADPTN